MGNSEIKLKLCNECFVSLDILTKQCPWCSCTHFMVKDDQLLIEEDHTLDERIIDMPTTLRVSK